LFHGKVDVKVALASDFLGGKKLGVPKVVTWDILNRKK